MNEYGALFENQDKGINGYTQWAPFEENTGYLDPSSKEFMINYCVENIEELVKQLKIDGVNVLVEIETFEY